MKKIAFNPPTVSLQGSNLPNDKSQAIFFSIKKGQVRLPTYPFKLINQLIS
jgi:hypothetical protein